MQAKIYSQNPRYSKKWSEKNAESRDKPAQVATLSLMLCLHFIIDVYRSMSKPFRGNLWKLVEEPSNFWKKFNLPYIIRAAGAFSDISQIVLARWALAWGDHRNTFSRSQLFFTTAP